MSMAFEERPKSFLLRNKQSRVVELTEAMKMAVQEGRLDKSKAASLLGRLQFAKGQLMGKSMHIAIRALYAHSTLPRLN